MTGIHEETNVSLFGQVNPINMPHNFEVLSKEQVNEVKASLKQSKEFIARGTRRVMEKVKEIRQSFSKAVVSGSRSGSGKIVYEHCERSTEICVGSANTEKLSFGIKVDDFLEDSSIIIYNPAVADDISVPFVQNEISVVNRNESLERETFEYTNQKDTISKDNSDDRELFTPNKHRSSGVKRNIKRKIENRKW